MRWILHTHLHIDHAGQDDRFPSTTTVVINRRELEHSVSGLMGEQYPAEYVKHLVDRLHTPGALRLLDLELSGPEEIIPGVRCEVAGAHTEGSMNVLVETAEGTACICGDVIYDIQNQIVEPIYQVLEFEPQTTGNHSTTKRQEKAAIKKALPDLEAQVPPGVEFHIVEDKTQTIAASVHDVQFTLLITVVLVVFVIFLFLRNVSATAIPSL